MGLAIDTGDAPGIEAPLTRLAALTADRATFRQQRPNDTTAYGAGDVVGNALTPGSAGAGTALMTFNFPKLQAALAAGGEFLITSAELIRNVNALAGTPAEGSYSLYLYNALPTLLLDNAAFDIANADLPMFIGKVILGTPVDEGSNLYIRTDGINQQVSLTSNLIYAYLVTTTGYTPVANTVLWVTLHGIAL